LIQGKNALNPLQVEHLEMRMKKEPPVPSQIERYRQGDSMIHHPNRVTWEREKGH